jgi:hypothetical protein
VQAAIFTLHRINGLVFEGVFYCAVHTGHLNIIGINFLPWPVSLLLFRFSSVSIIAPMLHSHHLGLHVALTRRTNRPVL